MLLKRGSFLDQNYTVGPSLSFHTFMLQGAHIIARVCKHCVCVSVGERMYGITTLIQPLPFDLSCVLCCTSCSLTDFRDMSMRYVNICMALSLSQHVQMSSGIRLSSQSIFGTLYNIVLLPLQNKVPWYSKGNITAF